MKNRRGYRRSTDRAVMVEVRPHQYVSVKVALELGLISSEDRIDVETD